MKTLRRWGSAVFLMASALSPGLTFASGKFLNVQGKLTDNSGNPLTGTQTVTFRLYTSSTAAVGSAIWTESQAVTLSTGLFNVALGTITALDSLSFDQLYYLGIQVAGDANELSPRQPLGASAYAQGSLGSFTVGSDLVVNSSVTVLGNGFSVGRSTFIVGAGTVTVGGPYFAVGGSTLVASGGRIGVGTASPATALDVAGSAQFGSSALKSTFTATAGGSTYALTASSGVKLSNGGPLELTAGGYVKWADGSTSTTAASAVAAGLAVLTATQTFSGFNTLAGLAQIAGSTHTIVVSTSVSAATTTIREIVYGGEYHLVGSSAPAQGTAQIVFQPPSISSISYRWELHGAFGSTGDELYLVINGDTGGTKHFPNICAETSNNGAFSCQNGNGIGRCYLTFPSNPVAAGGAFSFWGQCRMITNEFKCHFVGEYTLPFAIEMKIEGSCRYASATAHPTFSFSSKTAKIWKGEAAVWAMKLPASSQ